MFEETVEIVEGLVEEYVGHCKQTVKAGFDDGWISCSGPTINFIQYIQFPRSFVKD